MRVILLKFMRHNVLRCAKVAVPLLAALALVFGLPRRLRREWA